MFFSGSSLKGILLQITLLTLLLTPLVLHAGPVGTRKATFKSYFDASTRSLQIQSMNRQADRVCYRLYTLSGQLVAEQCIQAEGQMPLQVVLDGRDLGQGPYILVEHDGSRREASQVVIPGP